MQKSLSRKLNEDSELQDIKKMYREKFGVPAQPFVPGKYKNIQDYKEHLKDELMKSSL